MDTWITPNHKTKDFSWPLSLEDKITIFHEQTVGWQLEIAEQCINGKKGSNGEILTEGIPNSGYAVLHITLSYFEMIAKYKNGTTEDGYSKSNFILGLIDVFPILENYPKWVKESVITMLYDGVRCGLYHAGMTQSEIIITDGIDDPIWLEAPHQHFPKRIYINPCVLPKHLKSHLELYIDQLRDTNNIVLRQNFEKRFDAVRSKF